MLFPRYEGKPKPFRSSLADVVQKLLNLHEDLLVEYEILEEKTEHPVNTRTTLQFVFGGFEQSECHLCNQNVGLADLGFTIRTHTSDCVGKSHVGGFEHIPQRIWRSRSQLDRIR